MVKTTVKKTGKAIQLFGTQFVSKNLELLEYRATTSAGKPVSILRGMAKKCRPSFNTSW